MIYASISPTSFHHFCGFAAWEGRLDHSQNDQWTTAELLDSENFIISDL